MDYTPLAMTEPKELGRLALEPAQGKKVHTSIWTRATNCTQGWSKRRLGTPKLEVNPFFLVVYAGLELWRLGIALACINGPGFLPVH